MLIEFEVLTVNIVFCSDKHTGTLYQRWRVVYGGCIGCRRCNYATESIVNVFRSRNGNNTFRRAEFFSFLVDKGVYLDRVLPRN